MVKLTPLYDIKTRSHASYPLSLQWRHNGRDTVSNHQPRDCLLNRLFRRRSKKTLKLCVTGLCVGNSPVADEFPAQMASNAENVSIWWRHHVTGPPPMRDFAVCFVFILNKLLKKQSRCPWFQTPCRSYDVTGISLRETLEDVFLMSQEWK